MPFTSANAPKSQTSVIKVAPGHINARTPNNTATKPAQSEQPPIQPERVDHRGHVACFQCFIHFYFLRGLDFILFLRGRIVEAALAFSLAGPLAVFRDRNRTSDCSRSKAAVRSNWISRDLVGEIAIVAFTYLIGVGSMRARLKLDARAR